MPCAGYVRRVTHDEIADAVSENLREVLGTPAHTDMRSVVQLCSGFLKCSFQQQMVRVSADSYQQEICSLRLFPFFHSKRVYRLLWKVCLRGGGSTMTCR
jgi:hypothetical protein